MSDLNVLLTSPSAALPKRGTPHSAGLDLCISEPLDLEPGARTIAPTGIRVALPENSVGLLFIRSGLSTKGLTLTNAVGVIDSDYRGDIGISLLNLGDSKISLPAGTRVAQLVVVPFLSLNPIQVDQLPDTLRGEGGFGSTGTGTSNLQGF